METQSDREKIISIMTNAIGYEMAIAGLENPPFIVESSVENDELAYRAAERAYRQAIEGID